ncbi:MAG: ribonuclease HII [Euryarchaeota archaeon]|nr:ribonuclease HII [Euryarchaeota archaeon]
MIGGLDEAGRGPILGPLVIGAVVVDESGEQKLRELRVRDSKRISAARRLKLFPLIQETAETSLIIKVSARELDKLRIEENLTITEIEAMKMAEAINELRPQKVIVDAADNSCVHFAESIYKYLHESTKLAIKLVSEHTADVRYPVVSAASILAKVTRDNEIEKLKETYGDIGSGYPSDPTTRIYLRSLVRNGNGFPDFVRLSWSPIKKLTGMKKTQLLLDHF